MKTMPTRLPNKNKKNRSRYARMLMIATMILVLAGIGTIALSQSGQEKKAKRYVATKAIIFDQASHQLRMPTPAETQAMVDQLSVLTNRSTDNLTVQYLPNGTKIMNLEDRFGSVVVGRAKEDGSTEIRCVFTMEEAAEFLGLEAQD